MSTNEEISRELSRGELLMSELCRKIPEIANSPGIDPWQSHQFAAAYRGRNATRNRGELMAASFVLTVWSGDKHSGWSKLPEFCVVEAAAYCDKQTVGVIVDWMLDPFFP